MADGIKGALQNLPGEITQAVIKPFTEEVGKAIEAGVQSTQVNPPVLDPKIQEQKKIDEEKRKQEALRVIDWNQQLSNDQAQAAKGIKETQDYYQKIQEETLKKGTQPVQPGEENKLASTAVKKNAALDAMNTRERRKGVGG